MGFLFLRIFFVLSDWGLIFHIESRGMFRITLKISGFSVHNSSLGQTRLCPRDCSIEKQRFFVILRHFLEHFRLLSAVLHHHFLSVLATQQQLKRVYLPAPCLLPEDYSRIAYSVELL